MKEYGFHVFDKLLKIHQESSTYDQIKRCEDFADNALIWGNKKKKCRFLSWNRVLSIPKYQNSAYLLRRPLDEYPIKY
ncbi:hypothetical protein ACFWDG_18565, partial [Peribacillus sp. NPDC060186]